ncbi:uncharacterized protein LOC131806741 [Musca domestica]|uniref:Uncharacterized protein LOC131802207 n=1 Tax=Musca domestica TaxID=7370 RepID=A0ABM3UZ68_MUSDO|nr:uncharacterized protein LOC131802207 [Musca domestica]XP_058978831.1 uncharacterized protein LOC131802493 [Musca domestica]XP_058987371.1 uncharacterized protein LOC131806741 [Musca domestica]
MDSVPSNAVVAVGETKPQLLSIVQINLHHCKAAGAELLLSLSKLEVDIALVQEPYIFKNKVTGLGSERYITYATSNGEKVRTCIVAKKNLNLIFLNNFSGGDATAVRLETRTGKTLFLVSLYLPFEHPDPPGQVVEELVSVLGGKGGLIIGCDANAHHSQWGSSNTNARD